MANNITQIIIKHLSTRKWTKKNFIALVLAIVAAILAPYFGTTSEHAGAMGTAAQRGSVYQAKVVKVADGDTMTVMDKNGVKHKIRFAFIDAPEKTQASGMDSLAALKKRVEDKQVQIEVADVDRYQREVAVVRVNGLDINYEQVKDGYAWHYQNYAKNQSSIDYSKYSDAQQQAQKNRLGLWARKNPQAPWDYRSAQRATRN